MREVKNWQNSVLVVTPYRNLNAPSEELLINCNISLAVGRNDLVIGGQTGFYNQIIFNARSCVILKVC